MSSLSQLLDSALGRAETRIKMASAADADLPSSDGDSIEDLFYGKTAAVLPPLMATQSAPASKPEEKVAAETKQSSTSMAADALAYAQAIEIGANIIEKLAGSVPQTLAATPTEGLDASASVPKSTGAGAPAMPTGTHQAGAISNVLNNDESRTIPAPGHGKTAAIILQAKTAQANALRANGQTAIADALDAQVKEATEKLAQDPSSPQPQISAGTRKPLETDAAVPAGTAPDNAGAISLTRAQARDSNTRAAAAMLNSTPVKDPVTTALVGHTEGLKIASIKDLTEKAAKKTSKEESKEASAAMDLIAAANAPVA